MKRIKTIFRREIETPGSDDFFWRESETSKDIKSIAQLKPNARLALGANYSKGVGWQNSELGQNLRPVCTKHEFGFARRKVWSDDAKIWSHDIN
jgi:hypothetical protein